MGNALGKEEELVLPERVGGRYRIEGVLGRGGMGTVFRAFDETDKREIALKRLTTGGDRSAKHRVEMFSREYRTLAQLAHPSVIRVHEYGIADEGPYYTMELLAGSDLHALAPVGWRQACAYMRDVASSLALLHSRRLLHRDVSPRNVRCTDDHAKLIDFGAMVPMGPGHQVVGTPPLVPPEALHRHTLDGRCDLYALGGTLYWALTGRHAYPARTLSALPLLWKQRPAPPSSLAHDVPAALDALVLELLAQAQEARPRTAAEVMERLSVIAGLDDDEHLHVPLSYLSAPSLQGRREELKVVRAALSATMDGASRVVCVQGEMGVGRSRLLDAASVEAALEGAAVLRLDGTDGSRGDCGVGHALLERSGEILHELQTRGGPALSIVDSTSSALARAGRSRLISRARAMIRRASANGAVVLTVDDAEALDPASQALLATLPSAARRRLLILLSVRSGTSLDPALDTARAQATTIELEPLTEGDTEALLGSVFGDVPGVPLVAQRVHALSGGNPRATMELAQHLIDTGKARYELGGWALPPQLTRDDLPQALTDALDARLATLEPDHRDLAEVLAFALEYGLDPSEVAPLTSHGDRERHQAALDGLLVAGLLHLESGRYAFVSTAHRERLRKTADAARVDAIHEKLAALLQEQGQDAIDVAHCLLIAGKLSAAIDALLAELEGGSRWDTAPAGYAEVLQWAIEACSAHERPARERYQLLRELVHVGEHLGVPRMREHFAELLAQLREDGVLNAYEALPADTEPGERLELALGKAQARYDALPERERVLAPVDGIRALAMTTRQAGAFGAASMDHEVLSSLPDLSPFVPLSPAIESTVNNTLPACEHLNAGRYEQAFDAYERTFARLMEDDRAGLDEDYWRWAVAALRFAMGHIQAGLGMARALELADSLEQDPAWAIAAMDVRRAYHLRLGEEREAESCRRRIERMRLDSGRRPPMVDTSARLELDCAAHAGDLTGVRRAMDRMSDLIAIQPGYEVYEHYGPAVYELLRGNHESALAHCEKALSLVEPGKHPTWPWVVHTLLETLAALGRLEEAHARGLVFVQRAQEMSLGVMGHHATIPVAIIEARQGDHARAVERIDSAIEYREELGSRGLDLGWAYENRARVAISMGDQEAFVKAAQRCGEEYGKGAAGSSLVARYEKLLGEAHQAGIGTPSMQPPPTPAGGKTSTWGSTQLYTELDGDSREERFERALSLLMRESGADAGVLYRATEEGLSECARQLDGYTAPELAEFGDAILGPASADDDPATATAIDESVVTGQGQARWLPAVLGHYSSRGFERSGVVLLHFAGTPEALSLELVELIGRALHTSDGTITH